MNTVQQRGTRFDREVAFLGAVLGHPARAVARALMDQVGGINLVDSTKGAMAKYYAADPRFANTSLEALRSALGMTPSERRRRDRHAAACAAHSLEMHAALQRVLAISHEDDVLDLVRTLLIKIEVTAAKVEL